MNESLIESTPMPSLSYWNTTETQPKDVDPDVPQIPLYVEMALMVVGTIGNALVCLAIILDKKLQHATNFYLVSMAITDLLITVIIMPSRVVLSTYVLEPSSFGWCFSYLIAADYLIAVSNLHVCVISMERFLAIRKPLSTRHASNRRIYVKVSLPWVISGVWYFAYAHVSKIALRRAVGWVGCNHIGGQARKIMINLHTVLTSEHPNIPLHCFNILNSTNKHLVGLYSELPFLFLVIGVVVFSFIGTSYFLLKATKQSACGIENGIRTVGGNKSENNSKSQQLNTERKAIKAVLLVSFGFIVTMVPYTILSVIDFFAPRYFKHNFMPNFVSFVVRCNSVINPFLYTIFNQKFRTNFKNILLFRCKKLYEIK